MRLPLTYVASALTVVGLATVSALEAWRPGAVSGAIDLTVVWLLSLTFLLIDWRVPSRSADRSADEPAQDAGRGKNDPSETVGS